MIVFHRVGIGYQDIPKVGSTSVFHWLYEALFGERYTPIMIGRRRVPIHQYFRTGINDQFENIPNISYDTFVDRYTFCLTRDPIKRFVSAFGNRILHYGELAADKPGGRAALEAGLSIDVDINAVVEDLEAYIAVVPTLRHHASPMVVETGRDLSIFTRIADISDIASVMAEVADRWKAAETTDPIKLPPVRQLQTSNRGIGLRNLTEKSFNRLLEFYDEDYEVFPTVSRDRIRAEFYRNA